MGSLISSNPPIDCTHCLERKHSDTSISAYTALNMSSAKVMAPTHNLQAFSQIDINDSIDPTVVTEVVSSLPFVNTPGSFNARRLPIPGCNIYRTGTLETVTPEGITSIRDEFKIATIFDLRSLKERTSSPFPKIPDVSVQWAPSTLDNPTTIPARSHSSNIPDIADPVAYFVKTYFSILTSHAAAIKCILRHVLTAGPEHAFSFNCMAGKDRTGVIAYVLLRLAGVSLEEIDLDYVLTRIGIEPVKDFLTRKLTGGRPLDMSNPVVQVASSIPWNAMTMLDGKVKEVYGEEGILAYVKKALGFDQEDLESIVKRLTYSERVERA